MRALRGGRSQAEFSRRIGYRSNIAQRWETGRCWPTAAAFLKACVRVRPAIVRCFEQFFHRKPEWLDEREPFASASVAAFLRDLRGKTPILLIAERSGHNRYSVGRWLSGHSDPKLPEFLSLVEATSRRMIDFIATLTDPSGMATLRMFANRVGRTRLRFRDWPQECQIPLPLTRTIATKTLAAFAKARRWAFTLSGSARTAFSF